MFLACPAWATTYYVRPNGGTATQCTGTTNADYSSGTGQPCAFNHPAWALGSTNGNQGNVSGAMAGGDTLYILGDNGSNQAQYLVGYGMPNGGTYCTSNTNYSYLCMMLPIPAGTDASHPTRVIGTGTHKPQLYGVEATYYVLSLENNNLDVENIEITQQDSCTGIGVTDSGADGFPAQCGGHSGGTSYPRGPWASYGIYMNGTNITTKNLFVHRLALEDIWFSGTVSNWNSTNDTFMSSGEALDNGISTMAFGGNNTMTNDTWAWGGCLEHYPTPYPANIRDTRNYVHCADQNNNGLGGGFMQQAGNAACGNWTISYSQFLFNVKTNIDFLHCDGTGTFNFYRSVSEGSSGEALKLQVATTNIENSQLIADAAVWTTSPFTAITPVGVQVCRGGNSVIFQGNPNETINMVNDDITGNCTALIGVSDIGHDPSYACTGMNINAYNTKFIGGNDYYKGTNVNLYYISGSDGNGGGNCGTGKIPFYMTNSSCYNATTGDAGCSSGTNTVTSDPLVKGETDYGAFTNWLGPTTYYSGTNLAGELYLQSSSSPLHNAASSSVTYTNGSTDLNCDARPPWDIGAVINGSTSQCSGGGGSSSGSGVGMYGNLSLYGKITNY
jgi:hypothetical protein